jgi:hypothetical protein
MITGLKTCFFNPNIKELQKGLLFKDIKVCLLIFSMREKNLKEKHSGGLLGHFGQDKTFP